MAPDADPTDPRLLVLAPGDSVFVLRQAIEAGETITIFGGSVAISRRLGLGHKVARTAIRSGDQVIKYGAPIGRATADIAVGDHVHLHNLASDYTPTYALEGNDP